MPITQLPNKYCAVHTEPNFCTAKLEELFSLPPLETMTAFHSLNYYILLLITEGEGKHNIDYTDYTYTKGTLLAIRRNQIHRFYKSDAKGYVIFFKEDFLNRYLNENEVSKSIQAFNELLTSPKTQIVDQELTEIIKIVQGLEMESSVVADDYSLRINRSLLHVLLSLVHRIKSRGFNKVELNNHLQEFIKFQNLVEKNYHKTKKVEDYAHMMGFSAKKLNTIVNFISNKSVKAFIDEVVIIKAKKDILHTNMSAKQVAFKLGFNDPANFYKYFKKHTSYTPESFRKTEKV
jgi:AraC-like DNA-binding protein